MQTPVAAQPNPSAQPALAITRRQLLASTSSAAVLAAIGTRPPLSSALPLAPLGKAERVGGDKLVGLSAEEVKGIIARNLSEGQYFVSGDLTPEIFADDCRFRDPTNDVRGLSRYIRALGLLFDASYSAVRLRDIQVTAPNTIEAAWELGGYLKFPWHPRVEPFEGRTVYTLNGDGLVELQDQSWAISAGEALRESFTPTAGVRDDIFRMS